MAKIDSVYDFSNKGLVELKSWLEPWFQTRGQGAAVGWEDVGIDCGASYQSAITTEPTLIAYWPLNEASGNALDASGNGHPLLAANFVGSPTQGSPGPFPSHLSQTSYTFSSAYLPSTDATLDAGAFSEVTFECWLYPTSAPGVFMYAAQSYNGTTESYSIQVRSGLNVLWQTTNVRSADSVVAIPLNAWTYIAGTSSVADGLRLYLNGAQVATAAGGGPLNITSPVFTIGAGRVGGNPFVGRIAQVALYGSVLPAATLFDHYQIGTLL